jgi:hypothetical protein
MKTTVNILITDIKGPGSPTSCHSVVFDGDLDEFERKVDNLIEQFGYRKAEVTIEDLDEFTEDELETLDAKGFIL